MTNNILRGKTASLRRSWRGLPRPNFAVLTRQKTPRTPSYGIGDKDAHVFNCPVCARPLPDGTLRCPGCGTRLVFGVTLRRAGGLLAFGSVVGILVGGLAMSVAIGVGLPTGGGTGTYSPGAVASSAAPSASVTPGTGPVTGATKGSLAAMRQMALLDQRIATEGAALKAAVKANRPASIARTLRALSADAAVGAKYVASLGTWSDAAALAVRRQGFYDSITSTARAGLAKSISNKKAYKASGKSMLTVLKKLPNLDATARELAVSVGTVLPAVDYRAIQ